MAGMFYSLKEVAEKLNKTEDQIAKIVEQGRLREFRDGTSLLFKVDEVESLMNDTMIRGALPQEDTETVQKDGLIPEFESLQQDELMPELEIPQQDELMPELEPLQQPEEQAEEIILEDSAEDTFLDGGLETDFGADLTNADTTIASEGINVLGETDTEYQLADDTSSDTREASLEEIEEDISLDTFGSGSGLLDLSLQADDTSLGGILDEIYTTEDHNQMPAASASGLEAAPDTEQMLTSVGIDSSELVHPTAGIGHAYIEPQPDAMSNAMGISLFLPLMTIIYAAIIIFTSFGKGIPAILKTTQDITWYIMIGVVVVAFLIMGIALMVGGSSDKPEKVKKVKPKKEKKAKKEKKKKKAKG